MLKTLSFAPQCSMNGTPTKPIVLWIHAFPALLSVRRFPALLALMCLCCPDWGRSVASSKICPNEYWIHLDCLLVWFNMACIMKHNAAALKMQPDSSPEELMRTCSWTFNSEWTPAHLVSFHLCSHSCTFSPISHHLFNWSSIFLTQVKSRSLMEMPWRELD